MKRQVPGLSDTAHDSRPEVPDGVFPLSGSIMPSIVGRPRSVCVIARCNV